MDKTTEITIAGVTVALVAPSMLAALAVTNRTSDEIRVAGNEVIAALGAAALRMCWPPDKSWPARKRPREWKAGQPVLAYGHKIFDDMCEAPGVSVGDVLNASGAAYRFARMCTVTEEDVQNAVNFSKAPAQGA